MSRYRNLSENETVLEMLYDTISLLYVDHVCYKIENNFDHRIVISKFQQSVKD